MKRNQGGFVVVALIGWALFSLLLGGVTGAYFGAKKAVEATTGQTSTRTMPQTDEPR